LFKSEPILETGLFHVSSTHKLVFVFACHLSLISISALDQTVFESHDSRTLDKWQHNYTLYDELEIRLVVLTVLNSFLRQSCLVSSSVTSAMRYINPRSTYLLISELT